MFDAYLVDLLALRRRSGDRQTDRQTDRRTFAFLELLSQLKTVNGIAYISPYVNEMVGTWWYTNRHYIAQFNEMFAMKLSK